LAREHACAGPRSPGNGGYRVRLGDPPGESNRNRPGNYPSPPDENSVSEKNLNKGEMIANSEREPHHNPSDTAAIGLTINRCNDV